MVEKNFTGACDLTFYNIGVDCSEDAAITDEAITLFRNCGFKLVKWSSYKEAKVVL